MRQTALVSIIALLLIALLPIWSYSQTWGFSLTIQAGALFAVVFVLRFLRVI